jgi:two-component system, OmpR family, phosphate regulon sensor histidine kinase PhoR
MISAPSPQRIALYSSLFVALTSNAILYAALLLLKLPITFSGMIMNTLLVFLISLLVFRYALRRFILSKIRAIYKTIGKPLKFERELKEGPGKNLLEIVEHDVAEWAISKNRQIRELRKLESYRREFVGNVSHELKTPIFNAQGYIETLLDVGMDDPSISKPYLEKAAANLERLESIVQDLLEVSKFESGQVQLDKSPFDIIALTVEVAGRYEYMAKEQFNTIRIDSTYPSLIVFADKNRLQQVLENLISNAIKYGREKGGQTDISFQDWDELVLVEVSDNGPGIAEKDIPRLFERFFRGEKSRNRKMGGTGLGLSIVKNIINAHDQNINVRSEIGVGTTFSFTLEKYLEK